MKQPKEEIIIDGVDVSGCLFYQSNFEEDYDVRIKHFCSNWHNSCESSNDSNCYFKQLTRKTQECEELEKKLELSSCVDTVLQIGYTAYKKQAEYLLTKNTCYRKALEEIEGLVKNFCKDCGDYEDCNWDKEGCYYSLIPNLKDIINKVS